MSARSASFWANSDVAIFTSVMAIPAAVVCEGMNHLMIKYGPAHKVHKFVAMRLPMLVIMNVFMRGMFSALLFEKKQYLNLTFQISAFTALFFKNGLLIATGIDLLAVAVDYLRYTPPPIKKN